MNYDGSLEIQENQSSYKINLMCDSIIVYTNYGWKIHSKKWAKNYADSISKKNKNYTDSIQLKAERGWNNSKAGKIQRKHSNWSNSICIKVSNKEIWIGMSYEMLLEERGKPNHVNISNHGHGNEYQCCWDDIKPSCFYMKSDDIVTSYN